MEAGYEKLYAYLVGEIDDTLKMVEERSGEGEAVFVLRQVSAKLEHALLEAEEMYIEAKDASEKELEKAEDRIRKSGVFSKTKLDAMLELARLLSERSGLPLTGKDD